MSTNMNDLKILEQTKELQNEIKQLNHKLSLIENKVNNIKINKSNYILIKEARAPGRRTKTVIYHLLLVLSPASKGKDTHQWDLRNTDHHSLANCTVLVDVTLTVLKM